MPSDHANAENTAKTDISDHGSVTCSVDYTGNTTTFSTKSFIHVECNMGGKFHFEHPGPVHHDVISLQDTNGNKKCTIDTMGNNLRNSDGSDATSTLHMEVLRDMYESSARPSESAITASFTDTSIETFRDTLYGAIKHALEQYIESRFENAAGTFIPVIMAKIDGSTIKFGNDSDYNGFNYAGDPDPDGTEHGHMFLINLLNTCNQNKLKEKITNTHDENVPIATLTGASHMVMGLRVTTTGGFKNDHLYAVGVNFT